MFFIGAALWLASAAQVVYLPIWAKSLGRSGAVWFLMGLLFGGGWTLGGWVIVGMDAMIVGLSDGRDDVHLLPIVGGLVALIPTFVLLGAGRSAESMKLAGLTARKRARFRSRRARAAK